MEIHVQDYDWNSHFDSPADFVEACGDLVEGAEFELVRVVVGAKTKYRIVDGKPVPISLSFPEGVEG